MPQLDFSNPLTIAQVVWMALIFGALYYTLARYVLPQVGGVVEARAHRITTDLDGANLAKAEADSAVAEIAQRGREATAQAQAEIARAVAAAKAEAAEQSRVASVALDKQLAEAEQRIGAARTAAMGALRQVATETAELVVSRLTGHPADTGAVNAAIGSLMAVQA